MRESDFWPAIPKNKATHTLQDFVVYDTESMGANHPTKARAQLHRLRLGVAIFGRYDHGAVTRRVEFAFNSQTQFWKWVESKARPDHPLWVYSHNAGFDLSIVGFREMLDCGALLLSDPRKEAAAKPDDDNPPPTPYGLFCDDDPPTIIETWFPSGAKLVLLDTLNYYRQSLASLATVFGTAKLPMPAWEAPDDDWIDYCRQDVLVIEKAVVGFADWVEKNDLGKLRHTLASQAMGAFRHRFMRHKIVPTQNATIRAVERQSYMGGQVQIWYGAKILDSVYQLDVSSLYPSVMGGNLYPVKLASHFIHSGQTGTKPMQLGLRGVAEVEIDCDERTYPKKTKDGLMHVCGRYWTTLAGPELYNALESGHIRSMGSWLYYDLGDIFTEFVDYFWNARREFEQQGNKIWSTLAKITMNSLYGKFGQRAVMWEWSDDYHCEQRWGRWTDTHPITREVVSLRGIAGNVQARSQETEAERAFPAIAAYVTAYGRERMVDLREVAGAGNYYYQGVDSLYCNEQGYNNLKAAGEIGNKELGLLTLEKVADGGHFRSINNYTIGEKLVRGSIKSKAVEVSPDYWEMDRFDHLGVLLGDSYLGGVTIQTVGKRMRGTYTRGVNKDDGTITPKTLKETSKGTLYNS